MPATTPRGFPYPLPTEPVAEGAQAIRNLAEAIHYPPALVTSLPASPTDGLEVLWLVDAAAGLIWHLKYRAAATGANKWEFVGGFPLAGYGGPGITASIPQNGWNFFPGDFTIAVPRAGVYLVTFGATVQPLVASATGWLGVAVGATSPTIDGVRSVGGYHPVSAGRVPYHGTFVDSLPAGVNLALQMRQAAPTQNFSASGRFISILPRQIA